MSGYACFPSSVELSDDPDLAEVVARWDQVSDKDRNRILQIVRSSSYAGDPCPPIRSPQVPAPLSQFRESGAPHPHIFIACLTNANSGHSRFDIRQTALIVFKRHLW